jgi:uncharacterized protein GlcG (DUF336 family)
MMITVKALSLEMVKKMAAAAEQKAIEKGLKVSVAILDAHGNLKFYQRMDGSPFGSVRISQLKAMTSASIPMSTKALADKNKGIENGPYIAVPGFVLLEGGLPIITKDGQHIGAIGVSGATSDLDAVCAQAGLNAIEDYL